MAAVFITGGTGYMGRELSARLAARGHQVKVLARPGSEPRVAPGCEAVSGDALDETSYRGAIAPCDTFVHLVGVAHPSPAKAAQFRAVDLVSVRAAVAAAKTAGVVNFVYVSVAHPAPVMQAYIAVRTEGEALIRAAGLRGSILRPWYVLGPGHRWPHVLTPVYWVLERLPATREGARRLALVTRPQMIGALTEAVEHPADGIRVWGAAEIRAKQAAAR
jgi:uncharacterized protein YbjT (DUF2867 family)